MEASVKLQQKSGDGKVYTQIDLFKPPRMRIVTIVEMYQWFATTLVYYGHVFYIFSYWQLAWSEPALTANLACKLLPPHKKVSYYRPFWATPPFALKSITSSSANQLLAPLLRVSYWRLFHEWATSAPFPMAPTPAPYWSKLKPFTALFKSKPFPPLTQVRHSRPFW